MAAPDLVVIGSGPGGYRAAVLGALRGLKVVLVERGDWGGTCLNRGCVPKKDWYASARLLSQARALASRGIHATLTPDLAQAWRHQREVVEQVRTSYIDYLKRLGVRAISGAARFEDPSTVSVGGERIVAGSFIVATGSRPTVPDALRAGGSRVLSTDDLFDRPPPSGRRVVVTGSGIVGTEFAFILSMLGLEVTWLMQQSPPARWRCSAPARKALMSALASHDIEPRIGSRPIAASARGDEVALQLADGRETVSDWVLLGAGRAPATDGLSCDAAGVAMTPVGYIEVDERLRTSASRVYAIGDVANPAMTANHALADAAVAVQNIVMPDSARRDNDAVPEVLYSALELARIGITDDEAEAAGYEPAIGYAAFEANPAALGEADARGFVRIVSDMERGRLLGAEIAGPGAADLIPLAGIEFGRPEALRELAGARYNHPARAEELQNAVETLAARWGLSRQVFGPE